MAITGTVTSAQGVLTLGSSLNDAITFTPTSGSYTVEYPLGTVAISASSSAQTLALTNGGQLRILCVSGSVAYSLAEVSDAWALNGPESVATRALVSEAGNITAAELATTTGTTGQTVRLSDGENRGAILMWSTPEGASAETWCWWLWPQAAYEA